jgi:hypothetical protein
MWLTPTGLAGFFGMTPHDVHRVLAGGRVRRHFAERSPLASVRDSGRELQSAETKKTPAATTPPGSESPSLCFDQHEEHTDDSII